MVSALERPLRRSSSRTSMRVERPAIMRGTSGRLGAMLAEPGGIYYRSSLTNWRAAVNFTAGEKNKTLIKQANRALPHTTPPEIRIQPAQDARPTPIHHN